MKKSLFWKIMTVLFFIWLCLFLWNISIVMPQGSLLKVNKLTGKVYMYSDYEWKRLKN